MVLPLAMEVAVFGMEVTAPRLVVCDRAAAVVVDAVVVVAVIVVVAVVIVFVVGVVVVAAVVGGVVASLPVAREIVGLVEAVVP